MPPKKISLKEAPYHADGSLMHWAGYGTMSTAQWKPNDPFHATLRLSAMRSGYSAKYVIWKPLDPADTRSFPMFIADLLDVVQSAKCIENGVISARWMVRKRGQNFGLVLAPEL